MIDKNYEPAKIEKNWYKKWIKSGCFVGFSDCRKKCNAFSIVIPPPNVTGGLHIGHIFNNTIQDILVRHARQQGSIAVLVPGTDHAGIATQVQIEKQLHKKGKSSQEIGRKKFLEVAKKWSDTNCRIILNQIRKIGVSCDCNLVVHTLDKGYSLGVLQGFVYLYQRGYIYRDKRMVNWCPKSLTAISDEEVVMHIRKDYLYKIRYDIIERKGYFVEVATTRPETIIGDAALAIHPNDERYNHLHGMYAFRPFPSVSIPLILDKDVDRIFGTGILKVTPAHDFLDWQIGKRHGLEVNDIFTPDGKINCLDVPKLHGRSSLEARKIAANILEVQGLLMGYENYEHSVGFSERANVPIEPRLSEQWWLHYPKVSEARRAVEKDIIRFYPECWKKTYLHWLNTIQDWCISRQLWWGHRIPVWYSKDRKKIHVSIDGPSDKNNWEQDNDVLDTWASSWLWPLGVWGWPVPSSLQKIELSFWYPISVLVTGFDIIFFWVARMVMAGLEFMGYPIEDGKMSNEEISLRVPFRKVYLNGLIRDSKGRKMSKSLGNSPDPIELIKKIGADGLRMGMLMITPKGKDILFSEDRISSGRNFTNKLWNAARFRKINSEEIVDSSLEGILLRLDIKKFDSYDHAILGRLCNVLDTYPKNFEKFEFSTIISELYTLLWNDFCDWYVEISKAKLKDKRFKNNCLAIQDLCLREMMFMLHPFIPFITEQLCHDMGFVKEEEFVQNIAPSTGDSLRAALHANGIILDNYAMTEISLLRDFVSKIRALKSRCHITTKRYCVVFLVANTKTDDILSVHECKLKKLIGASSIQRKSVIPEGLPLIATELGIACITGTIYSSCECIRLEKEVAYLQKVIRNAEEKLANTNFVLRAPREVLNSVRSTLASNKVRQKEIQDLLYYTKG